MANYIVNIRKSLKIMKSAWHSSNLNFISSTHGGGINYIFKF